MRSFGRYRLRANVASISWGAGAAVEKSGVAAIFHSARNGRPFHANGSRPMRMDRGQCVDKFVRGALDFMAALDLQREPR